MNPKTRALIWEELRTGGVIAGLGHAHVHTMFAVGMAGLLVVFTILGTLAMPWLVWLMASASCSVMLPGSHCAALLMRMSTGLP